MSRRWLRPSLLGAAGLFASLLAQPAHADEVRVHATAGVAHAVTTPQDREFGWGATGTVSLELPLAAHLGLEGKVRGLLLAEGQAPRDPLFVGRGTGLALVETLGIRLRPFTEVAGPWASVGFGAAQTGNAVRLGIDGAVGWDFRLSRESRWDLGPVVEYMQIVQPNDALRPEDARVLSLGIHVGLGVRAKPAPRTDGDGDGIYDDEDACSVTFGVRTSDPQTNGCPRRDRDKDSVFDDDDACPDEAGITTSDPKTNGCPRRDRDKDSVFDDDDACPDEAGITTSDPKTNGCPRRDRDNDGVFDDEDACPELAGVRTSDPETNGCPAETSVHVERDRILVDDVILFDTDSPRVHHASWQAIKKLAVFIEHTPDILEVSIEGHTDATGDEAYNLALSKQRAESVRKLLIRYGVAPDRVKAEAFGRSRLKVQTARPEQQNRRVEFWITRAREQANPSPAPATGSPVAPGEIKR